jgi:orotate phosphoribosyltransferase
VRADERAALAADIVAAARLTGHFSLRSGATADTYFDKYRFEADPLLLARVASAMLSLVPKGADVLAGLELGGVPIATAMSLQSGIPAAFVRKEAKTYGTCLAVEGGDVSGKQVVMIEDVISTGGAVRDAKAQLDAAGATVIAVVCAIWRGDGAPRIEGVGVPVFAAMTAADLEA